MRNIASSLLLLLFYHTALSQNTGSVAGKITDKLTSQGLPGATISVKGTSQTVFSNSEGYYMLSNLRPGNIVLLISSVGFQPIEMPVSVSGDATTANASLEPVNTSGNEVVVSASRRPEKISKAPATIQVIGTKDINRFAGSNIGELAARVQELEYTRSGVDEITFNARGFHSAFNNKVFQLVDGRNSMTPLSGGIAILNNGSTNKEDIERVEVVIGPQSALYGPNAHNALLNYVTKDPRLYPGTTVAVSAGSQSQFSSRFRHAWKINTKWAYKLSGEYATGKDYRWYDTVYAGNQFPPGNTPFFGPAVSIPERIQDFTFSRFRGETQVYYSITPKATVILSSGGVKFTRLQVTTNGRNQLRDVTYGFLQARLVHPHFFANVYNSWGNLGQTLLIYNYTRDFWNRTYSSLPAGPNRYLRPDSAEIFASRPGNTLNERSQRLNAELQYNTSFEKAGLILVAGLSYQKERPNGFGISLVDSFQKITLIQSGAVVQLEKKLPGSFRFISSARWDHHSNFGGLFAPRFALVKDIPGGSFRITWGKAYAVPSIINQYAGINRFMFGNGAGIRYIPSGTKFSDPASIAYTTPLQPEEVNTWEAGFKGTVAKKLLLDITAYYGTSKNFISPPKTVEGRVLSVGGIPVTHNPFFAGFIEKDTLKAATFLTYFNYAAVNSYGAYLNLNYTFNKFISAAVKYSWFGSDITKGNSTNDANKDGFVSLEEKSLNAPKNRGMFILDFQNLCREKLNAGFSVRYVERYDFYSGSQIGTASGKGSKGKVYGGTAPNGQAIWYPKNFDWGPLGGFTTIDISAGYKFSESITLNMGITNLLNTRQIEFVSSPSIGRLFMFELKIHIPDTKR